MCLDKLRPYKDKYLETETVDGRPEKVAWKIFKPNVLMPLFWDNEKTVPTKTWLHESEYRHPSMSGRRRIMGMKEGVRYPFGFHCYVHRKDAEKVATVVNDRDRDYLKIRRVYIRNVVAYGKQWCHKVVVASEMYVCDDLLPNTQSS